MQPKINTQNSSSHNISSSNFEEKELMEVNENETHVPAEVIAKRRRVAAFGGEEELKPTITRGGGAAELHLLALEVAVDEEVVVVHGVSLRPASKPLGVAGGASGGLESLGLVGEAVYEARGERNRRRIAEERGGEERE